MSNRDRKACNKAIASAWKKERQLVLEGKGTRDWTEEQQLEIIELGKAFDDDGIAFEGQHMKSVEAYPEYQGDPDNIQLLSKAEHLEAHKGDFRNPTNWYYNPITFEFNDFGDKSPIACEVIELKNPIAITKGEMPDNSQENKERNNQINAEITDEPSYSETQSSNTETFISEVNKSEGLSGWLKQQWEFAKEHPIKALFTVGKIAATIYGGIKAGKSIGNYLSQKSSQTYDTSRNTSPSQSSATRDLVRKVAKNVGNKIEEDFQQQNVMSTLTEQVLNSGTQVINGLNDYSVLLTKGYNTSVSQEARHKILEDILAENGEQSVVHLLRFLISTRSGSKQKKYGKAIDVWKADLDFVLSKRE